VRATYSITESTELVARNGRAGPSAARVVSSAPLKLAAEVSGVVPPQGGDRHDENGQNFPRISQDGREAPLLLRVPRVLNIE
jgi:hypothetical protein